MNPTDPTKTVSTTPSTPVSPVGSVSAPPTAGSAQTPLASPNAVDKVGLNSGVEKAASASSAEAAAPPGKNPAPAIGQFKASDSKPMPNIRMDLGINLVPTLSEEEMKVEETKSKFNYLGAFSILFLVIVTILILGVNALTKTMLNREKQQLVTYETQLKGQSDVLYANKQILDRVQLYEDVQASTFSPKDVLEYWQQLSVQFGQVDKIELSNGLNFQFSGSAGNLTDVARLWHLLSVDERVTKINLKAVSKNEDRVNYQFEGELNFQYFITNRALATADQSQGADESN